MSVIRLINDRFKILCNLHDESSDSVYLVSDLLNNEGTRAMRILPFDNAAAPLVEYFKSEFISLSAIDHPNLTRHYNFGIIKSIDGNSVASRNYFYTYEHHAQYGSILEEASKRTPDEIGDLLLQICSALDYLHCRGYAYGNINFRNAAVTDVDGKATAKLYGIPLEDKLKSLVFPPDKNGYLFNCPSEFGKDIFFQDFYALGVLMFYLVTLENPNRGNFAVHMEKFERKAGNDSSPDSASRKEYIDIIRKLTSSDEKQNYREISDVAADIEKILRREKTVLNRRIKENIFYRVKLIDKKHLFESLLESGSAVLVNRSGFSLTVVKGEMGSGKTRFMQELQFITGLEPVSSYYGCSVEDAEKEYEPFIRILKQIMAAAPQELIRKYGPELKKIMPDNPALRNISPTPALALEKEISRLHNRIANFIVNSLKTGPSIVILENVQWFDTSSLKLLDLLINTLEDASIPLWLVLTCRESELRGQTGDSLDRWKARSFANVIDIPGFTLEETGELIRKMLGLKKDVIRFSARIHQESGGNPGFVRNIITALFNEGTLFIGESGKWCTEFDDQADYSRLMLPSNTFMALETALNTLSEESAGIVEVLSIFDTPVSSELVSKIAGKGEDSIGPILGDLIKCQVVNEKLDDWGRTYGFVHKYIRQLVYGRIDERRKKELHRIAADAIESTYVNENRENIDELIHQLFEAEEYGRALDYTLKSAYRMLSLHVDSQALAFLDKAYHIAETIRSADDMARILRDTGKIHSVHGNNEDAVNCFKKVLTFTERVNDKRTVVDALTGLAAMYNNFSNSELVGKYCAEATAISEKVGYPEGFLNAAYELCCMYLNTEKFDMLTGLIEECFRRYPEGSGEYGLQHAKLLQQLGNYYRDTDNTVKALEILTKSSRLYESLMNKSGASIDTVKGMIQALINIGIIYSDKYQDGARSVEYYDKALEISTQYGISRQIALSLNNIACSYTIEDKYETAVEYFGRAMDTASEIEFARVAFIASVNIMLCYSGLCEYDKAFAYYAKSTGMVDSNINLGATSGVVHPYSAGLFYSIGDFPKAMEAVKRTEETLGQIFSELVHIAGSYVPLIMHQMEGKLDLDEIGRVLDAYRRTDAVKDMRECIHRFINLFLDAGMPDKARDLLEETLKLKARANTLWLDAEVSYFEGVLEGGFAGRDKIENAIRLSGDTGHVYLRYRSFKALGAISFDMGDLTGALKYYTLAMDVLKKLVLKVPEHYRQTYISSHSRTDVREKLFDIRQRILLRRAEQIFEEKNRWVSTADNPINGFFNAGLNGSEIIDSEFAGYDYVPFLKSLTSDYKLNLILLTEHICAMTKADCGCIAAEGEDGFSIMAAVNMQDIGDGARRVIDYTAIKKAGILLTDEDDNGESVDAGILPDGVRAVICIPVFENRTAEFAAERRSALQAVFKPKGYIYLSSKSIFNRFSEETYGRCMTLQMLAGILLDNHYLKSQSDFDKVTGVHTRKYFEQAVGTQLAVSKADNSPLSFIMCDIDMFKNVNDRFGHQKGDEVLKEIGRVLQDNIRDMDICSRYGGEEFVILLPKTDIEKAAAIAERIRSAVESNFFPGLYQAVTISLGISAFPRHGEWKDELISKADQALYYAKKTGRNKVCRWNKRIGNLDGNSDIVKGILTGNILGDQSKMLEILGIFSKVNKLETFDEKILEILGTIIDVLEAEKAAILVPGRGDGGGFAVYACQRPEKNLLGNVDYNGKLVSQVRKSKKGLHCIDWENIIYLDEAAAVPLWQSVIAVPLHTLNNGEAILYVTSPTNRKELGLTEYNLALVFSEIISSLFP